MLIRATQALYQELQRQAALLSFNDVFFLDAIILLALVGVVWIIRKPPIGKKVNPAVH
jgi:MFS transporter, DHA2 family, multidrug resistance protein